MRIGSIFVISLLVVSNSWSPLCKGPPNREDESFYVRLVRYGSPAHSRNGAYSLVLDGYGRLHDLNYRLIDDSELSRTLDSPLCTNGTECVVDVELSDWKTTSCETLQRGLSTIRKCSNEGRKTRVYIFGF
jgi:hypothetical protein